MADVFPVEKLDPNGGVGHLDLSLKNRAVSSQYAGRIRMVSGATIY